MKNIKLASYIQEVENNRQKLITHCINNGLNASQNMSLTSLIHLNNTIKNNEIPHSYYYTIIDIDGTPIKHKTLIDKNSSINLDDFNANFDPDYLEFVDWVSDCDLNNITHNTHIGPSYQTKFNTTFNTRPTILYLDVKADITGLEFSLPIKLTSGNATAYIDWGDNEGIIEYSVSSTVTQCSHTYKEDSLYIVKIFITSTYTFSNYHKYGLLGQTAETDITNNALKRLYIGDNLSTLSYISGYGSTTRLLNLSVIVLPPRSTFTAGRYIFNCTNCKIAIFPKECKFSQSYFKNNNALETMIMSYNFPSFTLDNEMSNNPALKNFYFPVASNITEFNKGQFDLEINNFYYNIRNCTIINLNNLKLDTDILMLGSMDKLTSVYIRGAIGIKEVVLPKNLMQVGSGGTYNLGEMPWLTKVVFLGNTDIYKAAFTSSLNITTIEIPINYNGNIDLSLLKFLHPSVIIQIVNNLAYNSGSTICFHKDLQGYLQTLSIDNKSLIDICTEKDYTVSFA